MSQAITNVVKFVICQKDHNNNKPLFDVLTSFEADSFWFADGDDGCFNPEEILMFDSWDAANTVVNLAWALNKTILGIAIWESTLPAYIDYAYVNAGKEKNLQVKAYRESDDYLI